MPALIHFHRKWLIACDDLVIPFAIETVLRIVWFIASITVTWVELTGCRRDNLYVTYFLYVLIGHFFLTTCLCIAIFIVSSRGSVLQTQKRIHLSKILYAKCATVLCDITYVCYGAWLLVQEEANLCYQWRIFIEAGIVCHSLYVLAVITGIFICYNSLGSSFYWNNKNKFTATQIFKKAERIWRLRLKFFCCCADVSEDENDFIYIEISSFLTTFASDIDLAPTDILAGLITVSKKHAIEKRKIKCPNDSDALLVNRPVPSWMTVENALYYLRIAKSTYGWVAFLHFLYPWKLCTLLSPSRCCLNLFQHQNSTSHGDCCYCNSSAVEKITGLPDSDILYSSFSTSVYEPAFIVTFDHNKKVVIIAIRGTRSFSDLITDIDSDEMEFPDEVFPNKLKCHRGTLRSALYVRKKINELQVLKMAFNENPSYTLVITGHSLGGSIAAVLSMLLRPEYPSLQCYSYSPLATLSAEAIIRSLDFVFSVVVGDDISPRLSAYSFKELLKQICTSLEESQVPKYKLLTKAFYRYVKKSLKLSKKVVNTSEAYENKDIEVKDESPSEEIQLDIVPKETQMFAPGRILYLQKSDKCDPSWVTGFYFQKIIISPSMIKDHQPHQLQLHLEKYKCAKEEAELQQTQQEPPTIEIV